MTKEERHIYYRADRKLTELMILVGDATRRCDCGACIRLETWALKLVVDYPPAPEKPEPREKPI